MPSTYPSRIATLVDVPDPQNVSVSFQYNYFTPDERVNDSGDSISQRSIQDADIIDIIDKVPRFVKITWSPINIKKCKTDGNEEVSRRQNIASTRVEGEDIFSQENIDYIQSEQAFSNFDFSSITFQDTNIDEKLFSLVSGSTNIKNIDLNSLSDAAKSLNDFTRETVNGNILVDAVNNKSKLGILSTDPSPLISNRKSSFEEVKDLKIRAQINNKFVGSIIRTVAEDSLSPYADELSKIIDIAADLQDVSIEKMESTSIRSSEWDSSFVPIVQERIKSNAKSFEVSRFEVVGYIITKVQLAADGSEIAFDPIMIKGSQATTVIDPEIVFGGVYKYKVNAIASVSLMGRDSQNRKVKSTGLVASQASSVRFINCIDATPPPFPADIKPTWDYGERSFRLIWSFPVNRQRDIKYFQIFRRRTINEPFELIREFDFDNSIIPVDRGEDIDDYLVYKMKDPVTYFYDKEFGKDDTFIYTLCSIDAHGLTSNYSAQYEVSFNRFTNKLVTKAISRSGAPKAYPNMFLKTSAFIDTIKVSSYENMSIFFDPEYLRVTDDKNNDLNLLPSSQAYSEFKVQVINTDLQASETVTLTIDDRRRDRNTTESLGARELTPTPRSLRRNLSSLRKE